ncbi:tetratricopeptide repeat protein [Pontimicrobium sp. MEBiC06410]
MNKIIVSVLLMSFTSLWSQNAEDYYKKAQFSFESKDYKTALKQIDNAIAIDSSNVDFYFLKGSSYLELGEVLESYKVYSKAINKFPKNAALYNQRSTLLYYSKEYNAALKDISKAIEMEANDTLRNEYLINRGSIKGKKRDFTGSYKDLIKAYKFNPKHLGTLTNLGAVCDEIGKGDETLKYLLEAVAVDSTFYPVYNNIGFKYQEMGDHKKAIKYFNKVLKYNIEDPFAYSNRSYNWLKLGDTEKAMEDINKSIELFSENSYAYRTRALIYIEMKAINKACEDIDTAIKKKFTVTYGDEVEKLKEEYCNN